MFFIISGPVSRVLSWMMIYLRLPLPAVFSELPRKQTGPAYGFQICSCFGWGLQCRPCYHSRGSLLHCHFNLAMNTFRRIRRYVFCCAFPRVTPGGRYPSSCPMKPGLSSLPQNGTAIIRSAYFLIIWYIVNQRIASLLTQLPQF